MRLWQTAILGIALLPLLASASDIKTTYDIDQTSAGAKTVLSGSNYDDLLKAYPLDLLKPAFVNAGGFITSIQETKQDEIVETNSWSDYVTKKRKGNIFVSLRLPTQVTMLFSIEQSYRVCGKSTPTYSDGGRRGSRGASSSSDCSLSSSASVKGPLAVYGTFASPVNVDKLLREKQELSFDLSEPYDSSAVTINSTFTIKSILFEENLYKFMEIFSIAPQDTSKQAMTRQRMMLGVSRYLRQVNENALKAGSVASNTDGGAAK